VVVTLAASAPTDGPGGEPAAMRDVGQNHSPTARRRARRHRAAWPWVAAATVPAAFLGVFFVWPVAALVARGFHDGAGWTLGPVSDVLASPRTWRVIRQTLTQALAATVVSVLVGLPGAYVLWCLRFPGQRLLRAVATVPFVLPSVVVGVAFRSVLAPGGPLGGLGLEQSFGAIVAALVFFNYSVVVRTVGGLWAGLDPRPAEAARSLGAGRARVWATITLPALAPALASAASLVFLFSASAFGVVLVLGGAGRGTVETEIWYQTTQLLNLPAAAALSVVQLVIVSACLLGANAARSRHERALRLTGRPGAGVRPADAPALVVTALTTLFLLLPLATLLARSFATAEGWGWGNYRRLAGGGASGLAATVWQATANSLLTALAAATLAVLLGGLVSHLLARPPDSGPGRRLAGLADAAFMLPLGVSAVTVGFGFLITLNRPPLDLRSSWVLVPVAPALGALPLVVRTLLPTWRAIEPRLRQAAATLGAGPARVLISVDGPLLLRGLGLATGFAFATSLGEFGATSFLARPDRPTLPVMVYRLISRPGVDNVGLALAAAVVLAVLTAGVMAAAESLAPRRGGTW